MGVANTCPECNSENLTRRFGVSDTLTPSITEKVKRVNSAQYYKKHKGVAFAVLIVGVAGFLLSYSKIGGVPGFVLGILFFYLSYIAGPYAGGWVKETDTLEK